MYIAQNYKLQVVSIGFDELYRCDTFCPQTLKPGEEKLKNVKEYVKSLNQVVCEI